MQKLIEKFNANPTWVDGLSAFLGVILGWWVNLALEHHLLTQIYLSLAVLMALFFVGILIRKTPSKILIVGIYFIFGTSFFYR
jgi:hypothetical protein